MNLQKYKHAEITMTPNYMKIPVTKFDINDIDAHEMNEIIEYAKINIPRKIVRTPSGGISFKIKRFPAYDLRNTNSCYELTLIDLSGLYRFQFRTIKKDEDNNESTLHGHNAFWKFKDLCIKDNIDLDKMKIDNGKEVKETIPNVHIELYRDIYKDKVFSNCHHIDFHNSFPAGLVNTHPEFKKIIEDLYNNRHTNPENKAILNYTIGYMQSISCCQAKWAHLSKDAIEDNNKRVEDLAKRLLDSGRLVILFNTDGIWYSGEIYHGNGEGTKLGEWSNDHVDCQLRVKSAGAYEYIEADKYYPVVRGSTNLDKIKPRSEWVWGDIYDSNASIIKYYIDKDGYICNDETNRRL